MFCLPDGVRKDLEVLAAPPPSVSCVDGGPSLPGGRLPRGKAAPPSVSPRYRTTTVSGVSLRFAPGKKNRRRRGKKRAARLRADSSRESGIARNTNENPDRNVRRSGRMISALCEKAGNIPGTGSLSFRRRNYVMEHLVRGAFPGFHRGAPLRRNAFSVRASLLRI